MTPTPMTFGEVFSHRIATVSNGLTLLRVVLVAPLWWLVAGRQGEPPSAWLLVLLLAMGATDFLDGFLARLRHEETPLGRYLDPLADKVVAVVALYLLVRYCDFPLWLAIFVLVRDLVGVVAAFVLLFKRGLAGRPNLWGKAGVAALALSAIFHFMAWPGAALTIWPTAVLYAGGVVVYARAYGRVLLGIDRPAPLDR